MTEFMNAGVLPGFFGINVIESKNLPPEKMYLVDERNLFVRDMWADLQFPLIIDKQKKIMRKDLAALVRSAEQRLGLI